MNIHFHLGSIWEAMSKSKHWRKAGWKRILKTLITQRECRKLKQARLHERHTHNINHEYRSWDIYCFQHNFLNTKKETFGKNRKNKIIVKETRYIPHYICSCKVNSIEKPTYIILKSSVRLLLLTNKLKIPRYTNRNLENIL